MSDDIPKQPTTVAMPAVPDWAIELTKSVKEGFTEIRADLQLVATDVTVVKERVRLVEDRVKNVEDRQTTNSLRLKEPSQHDLETQKALSDEIIAREALATKVDDIARETSAQTLMLTEAKMAASKFFANPMVRMIATMVGTAIAAWLAAHGGVK